MDTQTLLVVPRGDPSLGTLNLEMQFINWAEGRIADVGMVTQHKAPELMAVFNKAWAELGKLQVQVELELGAAERQVSLRRSEVVLDEADAILKAKGLSTSKDLRDAVVEKDPKYQELVARHHTIKCYAQLLYTKARSLEWAYMSVKKIFGGGAPQSTYNPNHHNGDQNAPVGGIENNTNQPGPRGFGKANL